MKNEILKKILLIGETKKFKEGEIVFKEGSLSCELCFVLSGKVGVERKIVKHNYICTLTISKGEFFGEMALFQKGKRLAQIKSLTSSEIVFIKRDKFLSFIDKKKGEGLKTVFFIIKLIFDRMKHTNREMSCFYQLSSVLNEVTSVKEFIETIAKVIARSFYFDAFSAYSFNAITSDFEIIYKEGIDPKKIILSVSQECELKELNDLKKYGIKDVKYSLMFPFKFDGNLIGIIIFFKKKMFSANEKLFLKAILPQINSLLALFLHKRERQYQEKIKQVNFQI